MAEVIERTLTSRPVDATHWSLRSMAKEAGLSRTTVRRIRGAFRLQRHRAETFELSADRTSWRRSATLSASTYHRRIVRWCSVSTRVSMERHWSERTCEPRSRPSTEPGRCCQCCRASLSDVPITTSATAPSRSSPSCCKRHGASLTRNAFSTGRRRSPASGSYIARYVAPICRRTFPACRPMVVRSNCWSWQDFSYAQTVRKTPFTPHFMPKPRYRSWKDRRFSSQISRSN